MRPPVLPSGNASRPRGGSGVAGRGFNEAAGFTQRKRDRADQQPDGPRGASMRPPVLPSGNVKRVGCAGNAAIYASMRPPVLPSGNVTSEA